MSRHEEIKASYRALGGALPFADESFDVVLSRSALR